MTLSSLSAEQGPIISTSLSSAPESIFLSSTSRRSAFCAILPVRGYISLTSAGMASFLSNSIFMSSHLSFLRFCWLLRSFFISSRRRGSGRRPLTYRSAFQALLTSACPFRSLRCPPPRCKNSIATRAPSWGGCEVPSY